MTLKIADRVKETSTTAGTGTLNLAGAATGFQTFVAGVGNGNTCFYAISHQTADEWEVGIGTVTDASPDTLARTTVLQSSNSDSAVSFAAGTKDVFVTYPAGKAVYKDATGKVGIGTESPSYTLDVYGHDAWVQASGVTVGASGIIVNGNAEFKEYIYHNGDADTFIRFETDEINIEAGGRNMLFIKEGGGGDQADKVTVNNALVDVDFQVKGDNDANLFRTDAAKDKVGIGTSTPSHKLDVFGYDAWAQASGVRVGPSGTVMLDADLSHAITVKAPDVVSTSFTLPLPSGIGSNAQVLTTDSKNTYWSTPVSAGASELNDLDDASYGGTNLTRTLLLNNAPGSAPQHGTLASDNTDNIAIGLDALKIATAATRNIAIGSYTLTTATTADQNISVGVYAGYDVTVGQYNVLMGDSAGRYLREGDSNVAIGRNTLYGHTSNTTNGEFNTAVGDQAGQAVETGSYNTFLGYYTGYSVVTGQGNVMIGKKAGSAETGNYMLYIANNNEAGNGSLIKGDMANKHLAIGKGDSLVNTAGSPTLQVYPTDAADEAIYAKMATSHSSNLIEIENSSGSDLFVVNSAGELSTGAVNLNQYDSWVSSSGVKVGASGVVMQDADLSHAITIKTPNVVSTSFTLPLPSGIGTNGQVLTSDSKQTYWSTVSGGGTPTDITVADESSDTTCFPLFVTAATGDLEPKSGSNLAFNSSTGVLTATGFAGPLTGNVTGNASGTALTVTQAAQSAITSVGTLTTLTVDSIIINGTTIGHTSDTDAIAISSGGAVTFSKSINQAANAVTDGGAVDIDCGLSNYHEVLMNATATSIVFTNATVGQRIVVRFKQHSSHIDLDSNDGWDTVTVNGSSATVTWPGGTIPTLTETNNAIDVYGFIFQSTVTNVHAFIIGQALA